jgi:hypothetical protein
MEDASAGRQQQQQRRPRYETLRNTVLIQRLQSWALDTWQITFCADDFLWLTANDWQLIAAVLRGNRCVTRVQLLEPDMVPLVDDGDSRWVSLDYLQSALEQNAQSAKPASVSSQPPLSGI